MPRRTAMRKGSQADCKQPRLLPTASTAHWTGKPREGQGGETESHDGAEPADRSGPGGEAVHDERPERLRESTAIAASVGEQCELRESACDAATAEGGASDAVHSRWVEGDSGEAGDFCHSLLLLLLHHRHLRPEARGQQRASFGEG